MNTDAVIIIPAYNPTEKFVALMRDVSAAFEHILVVNDGSKPECDEIFATIKTENPKVAIIAHEVNKGKGAALKTAFSYYKNAPAYENTYGFVTADCDGQHTVEDMLMLAEELGKAHDHAIHMGARDLNSPDMPPRSKAGNKITAFMFRYLYGVKLRDTQTGLRAFSSDLTDWLLGIKGDRFEYEMNVLIKSKDGGGDYLRAYGRHPVRGESYFAFSLVPRLVARYEYAYGGTYAFPYRCARGCGVRYRSFRAV